MDEDFRRFPDTRLHYFNGQFLRANDFTAEQDYHVALRWLHNRALHTAGIIEGLDVQPPAFGTTAARISAGIAVDNKGREIVLKNEQTVELSSFIDNASEANVIQVYITIAHHEEETTPSEDAGIEGNTRLTQQPRLEASTSAPPDPGAQLILARISLDGGEITTEDIDGSERRSAGVNVGSDLNVRNLRLIDDGPQARWPSLRMGAAEQVDITGSLSVSKNLTVAGTINKRNIADDGNNLDQHIRARNNPHAVTATQIDSQGGANQIVNRINAGQGVINRDRIDPAAGARGWVRLLCLPKPTGSSSFRLSVSGAEAPDTGAQGIVEIPTPPAATRINTFRITGTKNTGVVRIFLYRVGWNPESNEVVLNALVNADITGAPFSERFQVNQPLNAEFQTLALVIQASKAAQVTFIALQFD